VSERPDYVPRTWTQGRMNRAFQADPRRVVAWFIVVPALAVLLAAGLLATGSWLGLVPAIAAVALLGQAAVYLPRALRASRRDRS
jgi:Flp pilus assembly protein TadB